MEIPLTLGQVALVDDECYPWLVSIASWQARPREGRQGFYARGALRGVPGGQRWVRMHRLLLPFAPDDVDHINGDSLDNRRANLRSATRSQNLCNQRLSSRNRSGFRGVCWDRRAGRWKVEIQVRKKRISGGSFIDLHDAARRWNELAKIHHGEFARLNEVPE